MSCTIFLYVKAFLYKILTSPESPFSFPCYVSTVVSQLLLFCSVLIAPNVNVAIQIQHLLLELGCNGVACYTAYL
jgi:hypothetical protein